MENYELILADEAETDIVPVKPNNNLSEESKALIEQIITETDEKKTRDLTALFNANQNKKASKPNGLNAFLVRVTGLEPAAS